MSLQILGLNHNTAPVEIREQVVFAGEQIPGALQAVRGIDGVDEAVLLSTCNRTEFYVMADNDGRRRLQDWLHDAHNLDPSFANTLFELDDGRPCATSSALPVAWIRWCSASRRSSAS